MTYDEQEFLYNSFSAILAKLDELIEAVKAPETIVEQHPLCAGERE